MKKCLVCHKNNINILCKNCVENPFRVENYRQILAKQSRLNSLKKTYSSSFPEIRNLNTPSFWNNKFIAIGNIQQEDGMTKDRVKTAYNFLPKTCKRVLDVGAGAGFLEEYLKDNKYLSIYANDFSDISIKKLKKHFKVNFKKQSIYAMKYPDNFFDCIFILEVLEHIPPSKILNVLRNINSMLRVKGILIVSVPMNENLEQMETNPNGHVRDYTYELIKTELEIVGFNLLESKTLYAFNNFYIIKSLLSKILRNRWKPNNVVIKAVKR